MTLTPKHIAAIETAKTVIMDRLIGQNTITIGQLRTALYALDTITPFYHGGAGNSDGTVLVQRTMPATLQTAVPASD